MGVFEFLEINPALADAIRERKISEFNDLAKLSSTFKPLVRGGLDLVLRGITTIPEVIRIAGEEV